MSIFSRQIDGDPPGGGTGSAGLVAVARWIGEFHRRWETQAPPVDGLNALDFRFLAQWCERALATIDAVARNVDVCGATRSYRNDIELLLAAPPVLLHGDCFASNALRDDGGIWLTDWELAALGAGEVDLATLTLGWPASNVSACTSAYCDARWPADPPPDMRRRLTAARRYVLLRILSRPPRANRVERYRKRLDMLLALPCV
jgi:aminoglycoside phosphotransferase (APT) family kinase protein